MNKTVNKEAQNKKHRIAFRLLKKNIQQGGKIIFEVISDSMLPLISSGDRVSIKSTPVNKLRIGDIIAYKIYKNICIHRLISKQKNADSILKLVTKGDNLPDFDKWQIFPKNILGKVVMIHKKNNDININTFFWKINNYLSAVSCRLKAHCSKPFLKRKSYPQKDNSCP